MYLSITVNIIFIYYCKDYIYLLLQWLYLSSKVKINNKTCFSSSILSFSYSDEVFCRIENAFSSSLIRLEDREFSVEEFFN